MAFGNGGKLVSAFKALGIICGGVIALYTVIKGLGIGGQIASTWIVTRATATIVQRIDEESDARKDGEDRVNRRLDSLIVEIKRGRRR